MNWRNVCIFWPWQKSWQQQTLACQQP
jgi:hypothetical protein